MARDMSEEMDGKRKRKGRDALSAETGVPHKNEVTDLNGREYEARLRELHVELVKHQEWVRHEAKKDLHHL
jgi:polyphosphate kinase 2 (PPK2 family)